MSYRLTKPFWVAERVAEVVVSVRPNMQASSGQLAMDGRVRRMEWRENSGVKAFNCD